MKRKDLIKIIIENGAVFLRHGGNHDIYLKKEIRIQVPRHTEIKEGLARAIIKQSEG